MIKVFNKSTGEFIGRIAEEDLQFLVDRLEEESLNDKDYYIRKETIDEFATSGASPRLLELLRGGLRGGEAIEIRWESDTASSA